MLGEISQDKSDDPFGTSYVDFYSSMIRVPFVGSNFNTIMPAFILIFGIVFALLSVLNLKNKALEAFKKVS